MENENRGIKRIKGERELEEAWLELGRAYDPPLWDTMDDYGSYLSKVADAAITLVCVDGHRTIGGISFYANDCESRRAFITQLMVLPECQGEGVGTGLLGACEEYLRLTSMEKLALEVRKVNYGAKKLYERVGFSVYDESPESYFMEKPLGRKAAIVV